MRIPIAYKHEARDAEGRPWYSISDIKPAEWAVTKVAVDKANKDAGFYQQRLTPVYETPPKRSRSYDV